MFRVITEGETPGMSDNLRSYLSYIEGGDCMSKGVLPYVYVKRKLLPLYWINDRV